MKFNQLQLGQRFSYQGQILRKTSPLMATVEGSQESRLLPRSATVEPLDAPPVKPTLAQTVPRERMDSAMQQLSSDLNRIVSESGLDAESVNRVLREMQIAFYRTQEYLNQP